MTKTCILSFLDPSGASMGMPSCHTSFPNTRSHLNGQTSLSWQPLHQLVHHHKPHLNGHAQPPRQLVHYPDIAGRDE
eukprot:1138326-Pelagomonas_calceolata.AAC.3